ncbi:cytochrome C [Vulgatibacter sp.]|uniref:cytochrome C n=1 Tax=Vulgatibacter sp. TaxID=1971226 RepID=UPI00356A5728
MASFGKSLAPHLQLGALLLGLLPTAALASNDPVGIALEIEDGHGVPLELQAGGRYYVDQIDLRAALAASVDAGVDDLAAEGDFADLDWSGVRLADEEFVLLANADGTFTRRRFFRDAAWMEQASSFVVQQLDCSGVPVGRPLVLEAGTDDARQPGDDFFVRRLRAIQWTHDCAALDDCSTASRFEEEALVELRHARGTPQSFLLHPHAAALQVEWSLKPWQRYEVPLRQVVQPGWDYGFAIALAPLTAPRADGTYAPGTDITFRMTLQDGSGTPLHPQGVLPTYNDVVFAGDPAGIQYYRAFFDPSATYYRRKHRERMLMAQIIGPAQDIRPIRSVVDLSLFFAPGAQVIGTPARDGVYAEFTTIPQASDLFGGAFDPTHAGWAAPVSDEFTFHIPADAAPGTYLVTTKGRRVYQGEDRPASTTIEIQVGQQERTVAHLATGNCESCHQNGGELSRVLHANANRAACNGCHAPLSFELEGPIYVRTHFVHSRSDRFDAPLERCTTCHLDQQTTQRVSKSACLSCHTEYPAWHEQAFGPVESIYVGGGAESFASCTDGCHQTHPGSGF